MPPALQTGRWLLWLPLLTALFDLWFWPGSFWVPLLIGATTAIVCGRWELKPQHTTDRTDAVRQGMSIALWETVLATMQEGLLVLDRNERLLYVNPAARRMLEIQPQTIDGNGPDRQVVGRWAWELIRHPILRETASAILQSGREQQVEIELNRTPRIVLSVWGTRLSSEEQSSSDKDLSAIVLVMADITQLRYQEQLRREFVSHVSHELKTPLTSIQACADTLLEGALDDPQCNRSFVENILEQSERLQVLIQNMLRLAKLEAQAEVFQWEEFEPQLVIDECVEALRPLAAQRQLKFVSSELVGSAEIHADREGVRTIMNNLILNAINYTPPQGTVTVACQLEENPPTVLVSVSDTGIGIAQENRARIFDRFYRVDRSRNREGLSGGGVGLGLAIVKQLVDSFHGQITVESEPDHGSRFLVRFPRRRTTAVD